MPPALITMRYWTTHYLKEAMMKITMFAHFKEYQGNHEKCILRVYTMVSVYRFVKIGNSP